MAEPRRSDLRDSLMRTGAVAAALLLCPAACRSPRNNSAEPRVISWRDAARHYDEFVTVEGRILVTRRTEKACFLNFHPDWRHSFTAVIFARRFDAFPPEPEEHYRGKAVRVTGLIRYYKGKPEIVLESPDQIEVVR